MKTLSKHQIDELIRLGYKRMYTPTAWAKNVGRLTITINPYKNKFHTFVDENNADDEVISSIYIALMPLLRLSIFTEMLSRLEAYDKPKNLDRKSIHSLPKGFFD